MSAPTDPTPGPSTNGAPTTPAQPTGRETFRGGASVPPDPLAAPDQPPEPRHRPWAWIAVCAVLAIAVLGVTIWAFSLQSDLDSQRDQTAAAQQQADQASSEVDQLTQDVNDALDQAGAAGAALKEQLQGAFADLKDRLNALKGDAEPPAEGSQSPAASATPTASAAIPTPTATPAESATPDGT
ncbi:hypothetical protein OM076_23545 [Solirubrobacter ginsenosidimutans]|uniref:Uncharacterized protein n=1 Tax=Solirubrobacter ginsenosidimutans TaxID=490573 RepID=A0A9X3MV86_9ACTN|nr:hypothetical protein [Solirubrobacter ginsenosidimutans]MDA0163269.1 hypothetical protein [Solirubrobacter ginsenosidimutans]